MINLNIAHSNYRSNLRLFMPNDAITRTIMYKIKTVRITKMQIGTNVNCQYEVHSYIAYLTAGRTHSRIHTTEIKEDYAFK